MVERGELRAIVFDVGETLVDESRAWIEQARLAGVPPFTLLGLIGALIERGEDHRLVWAELAVVPPATRPVITKDDLYPDALACLCAARSAGFSIGIAGNQPDGAAEQLTDAGVPADFIASSAQWGVAKPSAQFFDRVVDAAGVPAGSILYVGDRLDNDVLPARSAGMQTAFIRRGPWGLVHARRRDARLADLQVGSLSDLSQHWGQSRN